MRYAIALLFLLIIPSAMGATVHGRVYDFSLQAVDNVKVEINTTPLQRDITEDGRYSFDVTAGTYTLTAEQLAQGVLMARANEVVTVREDGDYVVDIILFPELEEEVQIEDELDLDVAYTTNIPWLAFAIVLILVIALGYLFKPKKTSLASEDSDELLSFIKKAGGRVTQKEIRKQFPYSEAKISLMITDLESQGIIKKIKKGRGNVIVLQ